MVVSVLAEGLAFAAALACNSYHAFMGWFGFFSLASGLWTGVVGALTLSIVPERLRGTATGIYFLFTTLFGTGLGPYAIGALSVDTVSLHRALALSGGAFLLSLFALLRLVRIVSPRVA